MHTTIQELTIPPRSRQPAPTPWRAWTKELQALIKRTRTSLDLVILECIAVALFTLLTVTVLFSFLPLR